MSIETPVLDVHWKAQWKVHWDIPPPATLQLGCKVLSANVQEAT